jgi:hypothetical protein
VEIDDARRVQFDRDSHVPTTLLVIADHDRTTHFAFATARRSLCLEHLTQDCVEVFETTVECSVCETVRRRMGRRHRAKLVSTSRLAQT